MNEDFWRPVSITAGIAMIIVGLVGFVYVSGDPVAAANRKAWTEYRRDMCTMLIGKRDNAADKIRICVAYPQSRDGRTVDALINIYRMK